MMKFSTLLISLLALTSVVFTVAGIATTNGTLTDDYCPSDIHTSDYPRLGNIVTGCFDNTVLTTADFAHYPKEPFSALSVSFTFNHLDVCENSERLYDEWPFFQMTFEHDDELVTIFELKREYWEPFNPIKQPTNPGDSGNPTRRLQPDELITNVVYHQFYAEAVGRQYGENMVWSLINSYEDEGDYLALTKVILTTDFEKQQTKAWMLSVNGDSQDQLNDDWGYDSYTNINYEGGNLFNLYDSGRWRWDESLRIYFGSNCSGLHTMSVNFTNFRLDYRFGKSLMNFVGARNPYLLAHYPLVGTVSDATKTLPDVVYMGYNGDDYVAQSPVYDTDGTIKIESEDDYINVNDPLLTPLQEPNSPFYSLSFSFWMKVDNYVANTYADLFYLDAGYLEDNSLFFWVLLVKDNFIVIDNDNENDDSYDGVHLRTQIEPGNWNKFSIYTGANRNDIGLISLFINDTLVYETTETGYTEGYDWDGLILGSIAGNIQDLRIYSPGVVPTRLPCDAKISRVHGKVVTIAILSAFGGVVLVGIVIILIIKKSAVLAGVKGTAAKYGNVNVDTHSPIHSPGRTEMISAAQ